MSVCTYTHKTNLISKVLFLAYEELMIFITASLRVLYDVRYLMTNTYLEGYNAYNS